MNKCYFCGSGFDGQIFRNTLCPSCGKEMKICMNCRHFEDAAHHQCREPQAEYVQDKLRANFCDYFSAGGSASRKGKSDEESARKTFEDLFS